MATTSSTGGAGMGSASPKFATVPSGAGSAAEASSAGPRASSPATAVIAHHRRRRTAARLGELELPTPEERVEAGGVEHGAGPAAVVGRRLGVAEAVERPGQVEVAPGHADRVA